MIELSTTQAIDLAVPLIRASMGDQLGDKAAGEWADSNVEHTQMWGYFHHNQLVGICAIGAEISPTKVWLGYLAVGSDKRRKGLGSKLLAYAEKQARRQGYAWMFVETYDGAVFHAANAFYAANGYKRIGELAEYLDDGSDAIFYRKRL